MVQLVMEYACVVWDLYYQTQVSMLEKVQWSVARWVLSDYSYHSSVNAMLHQLKWLPLGINLFYQVMRSLIVLSLPEYIDFTSRNTRNHYSFHLVTYTSNFHHDIHI